MNTQQRCGRMSKITENWLNTAAFVHMEHYNIESRDSPTVWCLCAFFPIVPQFYVPFYVKRKKMDNFMCLLEFECAKRLRAHSQAIPENVAPAESCKMSERNIFLLQPFEHQHICKPT